MVVLIGELAAETGVSTKTIRYYESIGLVPEPRRMPSGYRSYPPDAADRLGFIRRAQASGLSLSEIASILDIKDAGGRSCDHTRSLLERHLDELDAQIESLRVTRSDVAALAERAGQLDPADCTDPNRCQVLADTDD